MGLIIGIGLDFIDIILIGNTLAEQILFIDMVEEVLISIKPIP
jgi:hypothetical protein